MEGVIIILYTLFCIAVGFGIFYFINKRGTFSRHNRFEEDNAYLREQIEKFKENVDYWQRQANGSIDAQQKLILNHTNNTANSIDAVIQMLQAIQTNKTNELSNEDRSKIDRIIEQAKGIG
jgi:flagellar basal body-associated protein FliL